jgi:glycosyltransferase involved in cell wall biosynthesis
MLAYTFYETDGRVKRYAETLAKRGDHVDVIALRREGQRHHEMLNGVEVHRIQKRVFNEKRKTSYLFRLIKFFINSTIFLTKRHLRSPYDVIHVHSVPDFEVFAALLPKLTGAKIILDIHDIVPEFYISKFNASKSSLLYKALILIEKASIAFSNHVIISNHIWQEKLTSRSACNGKCTAILNYPDPDIFYRRPKEKNNGKFIIIYPGTLNWHQGVDIAIKAFAIIKDQAPEAEFHIHGEGSSKRSLENLVSSLGLENRVFFKNYLPVDKIAEVMANADLAVVPKRADSFGNEAFSTKILEFMALGVPVIVSDTNIDRHYFNDSVVKFFHSGNERDLAKSMLLLIKDQALRERLVKNAFEYVGKNNWGLKKQDYLDLIDSICCNNK